MAYTLSTHMISYSLKNVTDCISCAAFNIVVILGMIGYSNHLSSGVINLVSVIGEGESGQCGIHCSTA